MTAITIASNFRQKHSFGRLSKIMVNEGLTTWCFNDLRLRKARIMGGHFVRIRSAWCCGTTPAWASRLRAGALAATVASAALVLTACQPPLPFYQPQFREPSRKVAFRATDVASAKAVNSDKVSHHEAVRPTARSVRGQGGDGFGGISSEDEGLANDPLEDSGKGPPRAFESAVVGSDQWYRERAEDQAKEMELRRKLRICAC